MSPFPEWVTNEVDRLMATPIEEMAILQKWHMIKNVFLKAKIAYYLILHTSYIMTHPKNRGGLGLNAHNVHINGNTIRSVGADSSELARATCFELSHDEATRSKQLKFNKDLTDSSGGLLAPITGEERYLSVGCGHTAAFCRAANAC